jgi:hypothetical protein
MSQMNPVRDKGSLFIPSVSLFRQTPSVSPQDRG